MNFEVEACGLEEAVYKFGRLSRDVRRELHQAMQRATKLVADQARMNMARLFHNPLPASGKEGPVSAGG
ncbi:MAG: hypothetical protein JO007_15465 [Alphaproteobacteria bacterium]|nr:hypothetical protein [Alphaproteobacteria bacterium]